MATTTSVDENIFNHDITFNKNDDALNLSHNTQCAKMLHKQGSCFPEPEKVIFSEKLIKINRKGKEQDRVLLISDKAIYNLIPSDFTKCKRRIDLESIESVTISTISKEFVIHIPDEYDYRFKNIGKKDRLIRLICVLSKCYLIKHNYKKQLVINKILQSSLLSVTVTKDASRLQTREERFKRYKQLLQMTTYDDDDDDDGEYEPNGSDEDDINEIKQQQNKVTIDDFEFLKVIGRGSFGKVMQVQKKDNKEILAMKILKKKAIIARNQVEHTKSERAILQQLQHPFLMKLRYAFQTKEKLFFVLNYYRGGELFFHLKKKRRFTEREAQIFVSEVSLAIGHLHSMNVIYRDLKPENILLDGDGHICLTDFGLSKQSDYANTFCGTPEYLAPEIITNIGHSKAVDWWSLGILLYELTIGIPPYYSQNINEMYKKIQQAPLQFPPQSTPTCKSLISLLLERDPKYRLGSGYHDVEEIKRHSFFKNIDWILLYQKKIEPVYKPNVGKNQLDTSNFDKTFTNEPIVANSLKINNNNNTHSLDNNNNNKDKDEPQQTFDEFSFVGGIEDDD